MTQTVHVKGLSELQKFLDELPPKLEANVLRSALRAGAVVVMNEAKRIVPVATPNLRNVTTYGGYAGALRDSIRVGTRLKNGKVVATVKAGGKTKRGADVFYANWVEYGTAAHYIKPKKRNGSMFFSGLFVKGVQHPGSKAKPYMRPALDTKAQEAVVMVGNAIKKRLTKQGLSGAESVVISGDDE